LSHALAMASKNPGATTLTPQVELHDAALQTAR